MAPTAREYIGQLHLDVLKAIFPDISTPHEKSGFRLADQSDKRHRAYYEHFLHHCNVADTRFAFVHPIPLANPLKVYLDKLDSATFHQA